MDLARTRNVLLRQLGRAERERVAPHLHPVELSFKQPLLEQGEAIDYVYFPESGVVSLVTVLQGGEQAEMVAVGREGFIGLSLALGVGVASHRAFCQVPGVALRLPADVVEHERDARSDWFGLLLRSVHFTVTTMAQSAACQRAHSVQARMSRWLLMTLDRVDGPTFPLTQDFLAHMLGVHAAEINAAGTALQQAGLIDYGCGQVTVLQRRGLEQVACACYARLGQELERNVLAWHCPAR